ncbi:hypothetical protein M2175_005536 [Bradyrhizobium elkanii]|uniref:Uncharacterized protein n=1 Tax=Bradyrhizobium japonicum TaxID=375 RepID=A0A1L3FGF5_BRAJP|nr:MULTISPECIES: hypothetical protein [Bradyrhizobium]APG12395.1 hypothetical protein BKD09_29075 [Bradyrhizobium japonicum]MCS3930505.1 hypothetical protein [Bradyrhizobium elkanii]MCS3971062.1 hypothetical protein [Bradyrhizobium japonicum]
MLLLVVLPFLPELAISVVGGLAKIDGCVVDQKEVCLIAGVNVSSALSGLITAAVVIGSAFAWLGLAAVWLVMCYLVIVRGWVRLAARLLLALLVTAVFALLPYLAPGFAIAPFTNANCQPNEGGVGTCLIFGGNVGSAHHTVILQWLIFAGVPIALGTALACAIVIAVVRVRRTRAVKRSARSG